MKTKLTEKLLRIFSFITLATLINCTKPSNPVSPPSSSDKNITSFIFKVTDNPFLQSDIIGNISTDSVIIIVPAGTDITNLTPTITINGESIFPSSLAQQNFTNPVVYVVTAKDGTTKSYSVFVKIKEVKATLFINSSRFYQSGTGIGNIYAIDANTGMLEWEYTTTTNAIVSSPAFYNGFIYTGFYHDIACIDTATKTLQWSFATGNFIESTPTIVNGILYVNSNDQYIYAVDATTGILKWKFLQGTSPSQGAGNFSSPTVVDGIVYAGSTDGYIYAIDAVTGILKWKTYDSYNLGGTIESSPSVVNGIVYIGDNYQHLLALNATDGTFKWVFGPGGLFFSSPTVVNEIVYIGSSDNYLYAVDANSGQLIWKYYTSLQIYSSPVVSDGIVFVGTLSPGNGEFYAIDALNGTLKWMYTNDNDFFSSPLIFNKTVYVASYASVLAIDTNTGKLKWKYQMENGFQEVVASPCIVDQSGNIYNSGISGSQN